MKRMLGELNKKMDALIQDKETVVMMLLSQESLNFFSCFVMRPMKQQHIERVSDSATGAWNSAGGHFYISEQPQTS